MWTLCHFLLQSLNGCVGCLQFFGIAGSAAMNILACDYWSPHSRFSQVFFFSWILRFIYFQLVQIMLNWIFCLCYVHLLVLSDLSETGFELALPWPRLLGAIRWLGVLENITLWLGWVPSGSQAPLRDPQTEANSADPNPNKKQRSGNGILTISFLFRIIKI